MVEKKLLKNEPSAAKKETPVTKQKKTKQEKTSIGATAVGAHSYAIFKTGGKQYQAIVGKTLAIEKIVGEPGEQVSFNEVLLKKTDDNVEIGTPYVGGAVVKASIVKHDKAAKVIIYHFKRRKKSRVKRGHRQPLTVIRVETV